MTSVTKPPIDCTVLNHGLPRRCAPRRDSIVKLAEKCPVIASTTPSLQTPPRLCELLSRLCERSEAIHLANHTVLNHGLPRRYAPRRDVF